MSLDPDAGERGERRGEFEEDGAALCAGDVMFAPRALEKVEASVWQLLGWQPALAEAAVGYVDPALKEVDVDGRMPYLLLTTAASGYLRTFEGRSRSDAGSAALVVAGEGSGGRQELSWPFLLSPAWCGSERTGFYKTPQSLRLSGMSRNGVVYYCCTYYKAVRGDSGGHALPVFAVVVTHFVVEMAMFVTCYRSDRMCNL
jgi:hypothetical protein